MPSDFVGVYAAENQQMVFLRQVVERPDDGIEPLIATEKAKHPDQLAVRRHRLEDSKFLRRGSAADLLCFCAAEERERVIVNAPHAVHILHMQQVLETFREIEGFRLHDRMKRHRKLG